MPPEERDEKLRKRREKNAEYRYANAEKIRAAKAAHYQRTKDHHDAKTAQWRRENPERLRELAKGWFAKRRRLTRGGVTAAKQADWAMSQKKICHWCGKGCAGCYHIDHRQPLAKGGRHEIRNLVISCPACNLRKNARDPIEWAQMIGKLL